MLLCKYITPRSLIWIKYFPIHSISSHFNGQAKSYSSLISYLYTRNVQHHQKNIYSSHLSVKLLDPVHRQYYSNGQLEGDVTDILKNKQDKEFKKITELFPYPRATLNELLSKIPGKIFEVHCKQNIVAPKGKKKKLVQNDWQYIYSFTWPEKIKFESSAISKRQAGDKAATQALHWLYMNGRIDNKGSPIYDKKVLNTIRSNLNESIHINISNKSMERIEKIWNDYQNGIKAVYETTFKESNQRLMRGSMTVTKDSTIDEEDITDSELDSSDEFLEISESKLNVHPVYGRNVTQPSVSALQQRDRSLNRKFEKYDEEITPLPIDHYSQEIISAIENSRVTVIVGAAGCGKSSRAPAAVLRKLSSRATIVVSEPRRVAAIGLAERVASELGEEVGDSVGYQVRLKVRLPRPPGGSILYCTSGVLLRRLQNNQGLVGCSHVFIDEAHERDVNTDITLLLLKRALRINPELKVVIMSATLDTAVFTRYFASCSVVEVPGRTFPVEVSYLDDIKKKFNIKVPSTLQNCQKVDSKPNVNCQEVVEVIKAIDKTERDGAILVFLPGWAEIKSTKRHLDQQYGTSSLHMILPVHSRLSTTDQIKMFGKPPPGVRKIVLATNIAETSITIPDVVYVIDTGAQKENRIKKNTGTASLETVWVSQAGAKQRMGRAGRVQAGHCYRLYTKELEEDFAPHSTPEILRIPLVQTVLDCKAYAPEDRVEEFLSELPEPPDRQAIRFAVDDLVDLGALTQREQLTRLGTLLSNMTIHPRLGRSALHAAILGNIVPAANVIAHCGDNIELFRDASDRREEIRSIKSKYSATSDHVALHCLQNEFEQLFDQNGWRAVDEWCDRNGLRRERLGYVKALSSLYLEQLLKTGLVEPTIDIQELNRFSDIDELTTAVLLSGANALLTTKRHVKTKGKLAAVTGLCTSSGDRAHIGSESVNTQLTKRNGKTAILSYFGGHHSVERRALVVYKTSLISPHAVLLFSMGNIEQEIESNDETDTSLLHIPRHRLTIRMPTIQANHLLKAREMLWNTLQYYIDRDVKTVDYDLNNDMSGFKVKLVKTVARILVEGHAEYVQGKGVIENVVDYENSEN